MYCHGQAGIALMLDGGEFSWRQGCARGMASDNAAVVCTSQSRRLSDPEQTIPIRTSVDAIGAKGDLS
jgi:hypothetical protein